MKIPLAYYDNNLNSTLVLIDCMRECGVKNLVFSSSATVYGCPKSVPIFEDFPLSATNPYGQTKLMIEQILKDFYHSDLFGTDHCPGYASAAKYIATSVMEVSRDAHVYDTGMITIIECMGRHAID